MTGKPECSQIDELPQLSVQIRQGEIALEAVVVVLSGGQELSEAAAGIQLANAQALVLAVKQVEGAMDGLVELYGPAPRRAVDVLVNALEILSG